MAGPRHRDINAVWFGCMSAAVSRRMLNPFKGVVCIEQWYIAVYEEAFLLYQMDVLHVVTLLSKLQPVPHLKTIVY